MRSFNFTFYLIAILFICGMSGVVSAQPSAGQVLQEIQQLSPQINEIPEARREAIPFTPELSTPKLGQITFVVKKFIFTGNNKIRSDELQSLVAPFVNKPVTFENLKQVTELIEDFYREKGWIVRANTQKMT